MRYMLDTDICIYAINERPPKMLLALREHMRFRHSVSSSTALATSETPARKHK